MFDWQVVFAGYSSESLFQRVMDCKPKIVITCNAVMRGKKIINLKDIVDDALSQSSQNGITVGENFCHLIIICLSYLYKFHRQSKYMFLCYKKSWVAKVEEHKTIEMN